MALNKAKVFTITSVKGGVGKTTTVLNLAGIYSRMNKKVLIIDLDLYSGDIAATLNLNYNNDIYNLFEEINNKKFNSFDDYVTSYNEYIKVLAAPKDPRFGRKIDSKILNLILYKASMKFDVILIDTNHILTDINLVALDASDQILYLINNDSMNLKNMKTMVSILNNMDKSNYRIILNESNNKGKTYYNKYDIKNIELTSIPQNKYFVRLSIYFLKDNKKQIIIIAIAIYPLVESVVSKATKKTIRYLNLFLSGKR